MRAILRLLIITGILTICPQAFAAVGCGAGTDNSTCGNVGSTSAPSAPSNISACGALTTGHYQLTQNIGPDATADCLTITFNQVVVIWLQNFTITGKIHFLGQPSGSIFYGGTINCNSTDVGSDAGCLQINSTSTPSGSGTGCDTDGAVTNADLYIHHLTLNNSHVGAWQSLVVWQPSSNAANACIRVDHLTLAIPNNDTSSNRITGLQSDTGAWIGMEVKNSSITIPANVAAAQGVVAFNSYNQTTGEGSNIHNNNCNAAANTGGGDTDRCFVFDAQGKVNRGQGGIAANNYATANNNRVVRVRHWGTPSFPVSITSNDIHNITLSSRFAAIHIGEDDITLTNDPNTGCSSSCSIESNDSSVTSNTFDMQGGIGVLVADTYGVTVSGNTVTGTTAKFAYIDVLQNALGTRTATFVNNPNSVTTGVYACSGATCTNNVPITTQATVCNSGSTAGGGTISTSCPGAGSTLKGSTFKGSTVTFNLEDTPDQFFCGPNGGDDGFAQAITLLSWVS